MKNWRWLILVLLGLSLTACSATECEVCEEPVVCLECEVCEECPVNPFPEGLVLPQIYIQGRLYWTASDLESLSSNVIEPIVEYYESLELTVVSISVTTDDLASSSINTIIVEVMISDNDFDQDPQYMGVLIEKEAGVFPLWEPETIEP